MIFYEMFKNDLESRGMKLVFDDDNRYWIDYFFKRWIDVANLYFIHKQKKSDAYISFASKYSTFDELLDDLEEMNEDTYMLNIAAYLCICLVRMAYAANENKPWDVAFYSAQVPHIVEFLPAWRVLRSAHWDGLPIEEAKMVSEEQRVKSEIARKNAEKRNQKYTQLR